MDKGAKSKVVGNRYTKKSGGKHDPMQAVKGNKFKGGK